MPRLVLPLTLAVLVAAIAAVGLVFAAAPTQPVNGFKDTPMLPGGKWHVHDPDRPQPPVVTPGAMSASDTSARPPSDAVVLFDGHDLAKWKGKDGKDAKWIVKDGVATLNGTGEITTRDNFGDCQLHIEWSAPTPPKGHGQERGNSGVFLFGQYEIQILDSYENPTYADGAAAAVYGQTPPLVNAVRPPGEWNVYDIVFTGPRFKDGKLETPAYATVLVNGILVQNHTAVLGPTAWRSAPKYAPHGPKGPIMLQDHNNPMRFRNIWIRELKQPEP